ncbi:hypothetical protein [Tichowtungia aerotolerans]|uniref:Uncharacterized protein n=1 Tax=Tichowtungia aerotolerans TaxID=2697043 RepID=A0A6P1M6Z8_9BACT|nr:hypothetical protein [Tichowtungia aerotolerans]QHI70360.1 hypothetical protein GT409_13225 [Tichowtungia aerotolerans]
MKKIYFILAVLCICVTAGKAYELRDWEDVDGNRFKGRFVRELFGKLTIEDDEGNQSTFEIADLSDMDKKYIRVMIPPKVEVVVRAETKRLPKRPADLTRDDIEDVYWLSADITKKSQRPFTSRLNVEAFLVADEYEGDNYILLGRFEDSFLLLEEKDYGYTYKSPKVQCTLFSQLSTGERKGELYKGHIFIITSQQGDVVFTHSSLPKWMQEPEMIEKLRDLSVRGAPSVRSRHFNKEGEKVHPPQPRYCPITTN